MSKQGDLFSDDECKCSVCKPPIKVKTEKDLNTSQDKKKPTQSLTRGWRP